MTFETHGPPSKTDVYTATAPNWRGESFFWTNQANSLFNTLSGLKGALTHRRNAALRRDGVFTEPTLWRGTIVWEQIDANGNTVQS